MSGTAEVELKSERVYAPASEVGVTRGGQHGEDAVLDLEQRHIEGAAAQVEHQDGLLLLRVHALRVAPQAGLDSKVWKQYIMF